MNQKDKEKTKLKLIRNDEDLTIKQRAFVREIVKGKLGSQIDCYMQTYDVARTKTGGIPKHAHVDCSKLMANPKISLAVIKQTHPFLYRESDPRNDPPTPIYIDSYLTIIYT